LQFRHSSDDTGCIAESRVRTTANNHPPTKSLDYYASIDDIHQPPYALVRRLWQSVGGYYLPGGKALFLGATDHNKEPRTLNLDPLKPRSLTTTHDICQEAMAQPEIPRTDDYMRQLLWGSRSQWPKHKTS